MPSTNRSSETGFGNSITRFEELARHAESVSQLNTQIAYLPPTPLYARFRNLEIFHRGELAELIRRKIPRWHPELLLDSVNTRADVFLLGVTGSNKLLTRGIFAILPGKQRNLHRLVTVSYTDFWVKGVRRLAKRFYPDAMPIFYKQNEIKDSLLYLEASLPDTYRILITDATMKRKLPPDAVKSKRRFETERIWTQVPIGEMFDNALEGNFWFVSVEFKIEQQSRRTGGYKVVARGRIYKNGEVHCDAMQHEIGEQIVAKLEMRAAERLEFFSGRGIRERDYRSARPITVSYRTGIFSDNEEVRRFGEIINRYPKSTKAILHANPYYRANIADFLDGSSLEIWILAPDRILLKPQATCSERALERLISYIFFEFAEGELGEF